MEAITTTTTLWNILENSKIVIPTFQRDYAQGRAGKEDLRKKFLKEIKEVLSSDDKELLLDFVYGTKIDDTIYPLDGQQRLTTLWVLMWYATFKNPESENKKSRVERLKKFTYETRPSSRNFLEWLCGDFLETENGNKSNKSLSDYIQSQNGFYSGWKQDPTVQSILRMLSGTKRKDKDLSDGIEQVFKDQLNCLDKLFKEKCPIKFYHLNLIGIKHPDNLYVKMNARGEQLTGFENFKADLVDFMSKEDDLKEYVTLNNNKYILKKWDIDWTNLFWKIRGESDSVDDLFFTFIKRFLLNQYIVNRDKVDKEDEISKLLYENEQKGYTSFELYEQLIKTENIVSLVKVLDNLKGIIIDLPLLGSQGYASFLPQYGDDKETVKSASFQERVLMYGICLYLQEEKSQKCNFNHWLRVLGNLVYYNEISSFKEYESRIRFIKKVEESLGKNLGDVYSNEAVSILEELANEADTENYIQLKEEVQKIKMINKNHQLEETLKNIESLWIFSGRIDCLLTNSLLGNKELIKKLGELIGEEKKKYLYNSDNLIRFFQAILAKTAKGDKLPERLKINDEHDNFRKILNNEFKESLQAVLTEVLSNNNSLDDIITNYSYEEDDWKYALIKDKSLWNYSYGKFGKHFADEDEVYLYKGTNRNPADIPLKAYSKFINKKYQENGKFPKNIEYQKDQEKWMVCYDNGECVEFRPYHESNSVII